MHSKSNEGSSTGSLTVRDHCTDSLTVLGHSLYRVTHRTGSLTVSGHSLQQVTHCNRSLIVPGHLPYWVTVLGHSLYRVAHRTGSIAVPGHRTGSPIQVSPWSLILILVVAYAFLLLQKKRAHDLFSPVCSIETLSLCHLKILFWFLLHRRWVLQWRLFVYFPLMKCICSSTPLNHAHV